MKHKGSFKKVEKTQKPMYGPRKLLVCGYPDEERGPFLELLEAAGLGPIPVVFATSEDLEKSLGDILSAPERSQSPEPSPMKRTVIMSGLLQKELHALMGAYRKARLPSQLWAGLTPVSENWPLSRLLQELEAEALAIRSQQKR